MESLSCGHCQLVTTHVRGECTRCLLRFSRRQEALVGLFATLIMIVVAVAIVPMIPLHSERTRVGLTGAAIIGCLIAVRWVLAFVRGRSYGY